MATVTVIAAFVISAQEARAQTTVYHLHRENSSTAGLLQISTSPPEPPVLALQSVDLKNLPIQPVYIKSFDSPIGVPNAVGTIPANSTITFDLWMRKTANRGAMSARAELYLNATWGPALCAATGPVLDTNLLKRTFSCTTQSAVQVTTSDRFYLQVGINLTGTSNNSVNAELQIEGASGGNYDSTVTVPEIVPPPPIVSSASPMSGPVNTLVTLSGSHFRSSQGTGTVTFNGTLASITSWSNTSIGARVPAGAATGPIVVTTPSGASSPLVFTVSGVGSVTGTVTDLSGAAVSGALVEVLQSGVLKATRTTGAGGTYSVTNLVSGTYDLRASAAGLLSVVRAGVPVPPSGNTVNFTLGPGGSLGGAVTNGTGVGISGASITVFQGSTAIRTAVANGSGAYSVSGLGAGTYDVEASAPGHHSARLSNVTVTAGASTTANVTLNATTAAPVRYTYDELGRLRAVVNPAGETARYNYDAVGNILSITRENSNGVLVLELSPDEGPAGTAVTISGNGFSPIAAQNAVTFDGISATVSQATETRLVVTVPGSAPNGALTVSVTSPAGTGLSPAPFTVGPTGAPTIVSFTPTIGAPGTVINVTGANFSATTADNDLTVNITQSTVTAATATTISATVPSTARTGRLTVLTPSGIGTSAAHFFVPPAPYTVSQVQATQVIPLGVPTAVPGTTAGRIALLAFDGLAGHRVSFGFTTSGCGTFRLYDTRRDPTPFFYDYTEPVTTSGGFSFIETRSLPFTGTYTMLLDSCTGPTTVTVHDVPPDVTGPIPLDGEITLTPQVPGQNGRYTFNGTAGQRVSLWQPNGCGVTKTGLLEPGQQVSFPMMSVCGGGGPVTLTKSGTHTVFVDPQSSSTTAATVRLYSVPPDFFGSISPGGPDAQVPIEKPGQNGTLTFQGAQNQLVSLTLTQPTITRTDVYIYDPNGAQIRTQAITGGSGFIDTFQLPQAGEYRIFLDPSETNIGTITVRLYNVPTPGAGSLTPGPTGVVVPVSTNTPGQNVEYTFAGTAQQFISFRMTQPNLTQCADVTIFTPTNATLVTSAVCSTDVFVDRRELPSTGAYRLLVNPRTTGTGTVNLTLYSFADATGTLTLGGNPVSIATTAPGQKAILTFSGTSGQQATVRIVDNPVGCLMVRLERSDSSLVTSSTICGSTGNLSTQTLSATGTYRVVIDPTGTLAGTVSVRVTNP